MGLTTFLLGYLNVYSLQYNEASLISAQTGNLVNLGIKISHGDFYAISNNVSLITGFALGCLLATWLLIRAAHQTYYHLISWLGFSSIIWINTLFHSLIQANISILLLSFASGWALTLFREFAHSDLNNGIMTGNLKNMYCGLAKGILDKKNTHFRNAVIYLCIIFLFLIGAIFGGITTQYGAQMTLVTASILAMIPYFFIVKVKKEYVKEHAVK